MKIYAISFVKNEADIIALNLQAASKWADKIYVFDNGSTDSTWDIVQLMSSETIIPYRQSFDSFNDTLRREVFEYFRNELNDGDWICFRLDADEFYIDNPKMFLSKLPSYVSLVYGLNVEFQFTEDNLKFQDDIFYPERFKYAKIETIEQRFIKYRKKLVWNIHDSIPLHPGVSSKKFINFAHYQYRSKFQIENRLSTRIEAINNGFNAYWGTYQGKNWTNFIQEKSKLYLINSLNNIESITKEANVKFPESFIRQLIKMIMHGFKLWS